MSNFFSTGRFKLLESAKYNLDKYGENSSKSCFLEVELEYLEELHKLHNDYPLALDQLEIKRKILSGDQLIVADDYNISIGNGKKLVSNFFNKKKHVLHYKNFLLYLRL